MNTAKDFAALSGLWNEKQVDEAIEMIHRGEFSAAANKLDRIELSDEKRRSQGNLFAQAYYRRALISQNRKRLSDAINDLEKSLGFPNLSSADRNLYENRIKSIKKKGNESIAEVERFDRMIEENSGEQSSELSLRNEFLKKFKLSNPRRRLNIEGVDSVSSIGVYRWQGDPNRNEMLSRLIREFKQGERLQRAIFGRILAEHALDSDKCKKWLNEVDFIVPVPASRQRSVHRGADIVGTVAGHFGCRLSIPIKKPLERLFDLGRAKDLTQSQVESQYSFRSDSALHINERRILLLDDVVTRGFTARACAKLSKSNGCTKVYLLTLAQSESSLQSQRHNRND